MPWLSVLWLVPLAGSVLIILLPPGLRQLAKWTGLVVSVATLAVAIVVATGFKTGGAPYQFLENHPWIPAFGAGYSLGVDGIAVILVLLTAVLIPLLLVAGWNDGGEKNPGRARLHRADAGHRVDGADLGDRTGCVAVLRVLRGHAHPDVLPHRRLR